MNVFRLTLHRISDVFQKTLECLGARIDDRQAKKAIGAIVVSTVYIKRSTRVTGLYEGLDDDHETFESLKKDAEVVDDHLAGDHICNGIVNIDFPSRCDRLIAELASRCEVDLDGSLGSLDTLENRLHKMYGLFVDEDFDMLQREVFPGLMAYSDQIAINQTSDRWEIVEVETGVFEPWVVSGNKRFEIIGGVTGNPPGPKP